MNERTEKEKYDAMHQVPGYSPGPGIAHVSKAHSYMLPGDSIIDFGCGTGDAAQAFISLGHDVRVVDISDKGLRHDFGKRFYLVPIHKLPKTLPSAQWGFCADTMEHLPTGWVAPSLKQISGKVGNCYFSICGAPDSWGRHINDVLHLTVMPGAWWVEQIGRFWSDVLMIEDGSTYEIVARGAKRV